VKLNNFSSWGAVAQSGPCPPHSWGLWLTHDDAPQSVGLLWKNDQPVAETSTWQHTTDKHPCPRCDSNPQLQQASSRRTTSQTARPLGSAEKNHFLKLSLNSLIWKYLK